MKEQQLACRIGIYGAGLLVLTFGVALCTKANVGVSCVTSISYSVATAFGLNFPRTLLVVYLIFVSVQIVLDRRKRLLQNILQIPFSILFSLFLDWFETLLNLYYAELWKNLLLLFVSIVLMGIGVSLTVNMNIAANPPDGLTRCLSEKTGLSMGLMKNIVDSFSVVIALIVDIRFFGRVHSVGIGTVMCMIFVGRTIAVFDHYYKDKMLRICGIQP